MKSFKYSAKKTLACLFFGLLVFFQIQEALSSSGVCNTTTTNRDFVNAPWSNLCSNGSLRSPPGVSDNGAGQWQWTCKRSGSTGSDSPLCLADKVNCGTANNTTTLSSPTNLCSAGKSFTPTSNANNTAWSWQCTGYDSSNLVNCSAKIPGACGTATSTPSLTKPTSSLCSGGQSSDPTAVGDSWNWTCTGGDNSIADCSAKIPGACGDAVNHGYIQAPTSDLCSDGTSSTPAVIGAQWQWNCTRASNGAASDCRADVVACGTVHQSYQFSQPTIGLCSNGTAANQQHNTTNPNDPQWTWDCMDYLSQSVNCYAHEKVAGSCGDATKSDYVNPPAVDLCLAGIPTTVNNDSNDHWKWSCVGINGGVPALNCQSDIVNCGTTVQGKVSTSEPAESIRCDDGEPSDPVHTPPLWTWTCKDDINDEAQCKAYDSDASAYCGDAYLQTYIDKPTSGICAAGYTPTPVTQKNNKWNWKCQKWPKSYDCFAYDLDNGVCGTANGTPSESKPTSSLCSSGNYTEVTEDGTTWKWTCNGINGGTNVDCSATHITNGDCGSANGGTYEVEPTSGLCGAGVASAVIANNNLWNWTCDGIAGGTTESCTANRIIVNNYCAAPPFLVSQTQPNVMSVIDASGSMGWCAYNPKSDKRECCNDSDGCGWTYNQNEEGYYRPDKNYRYNGTSEYWEETVTGTITACPNIKSSIDNAKIYKGSCLNFLTMSRMDLVRWAMTGGRPLSCSKNTFTADRCDPELWDQPGNATKVGEVCNDTIGGCILETTMGKAIKVPWSRVRDGLVFQFKAMSPKPRMGAIFYSDKTVRSDGQVYMGDFTASNSKSDDFPYLNLVTAINSTAPDGGTPTGPAMWDALNYFQQKDPEHGGIEVQSGGGDRWKNPMYVCPDKGGANCKEISCAKNFVLLMSDGQWNSPSCSIDNQASDPVKPAWEMHKGFTNLGTGKATNVNATHTIGLFLGGTGEQSLKNVAMYGSFNKTSGYPGNLTGFPAEKCTMDDCGAGKGSGCTDLPASTSDWDTENPKNIPDTFHSATNAIEIKISIKNAILDMLRRTSSGTAVSVLSSSEGSGANLMQALFYPKRTFADGAEISWTSDLMNYWYYMDPFFTSANIREDTVREGATEAAPYTLLDLKQDYISAFIFDDGEKKTLAYRKWDENGNGSSLVDQGRVAIEETAAIWRAGFNLWWTNPTDRKIWTSVDVVASTSSTPSTAPTLIEFNTDTTTVAALDDYLGKTASVGAAKATINYVRGYDCVDSSGVGGDCSTASNPTAYTTSTGRNRTVSSGVCSVSKSPCNDDGDCPTNGGSCSTTPETHVWKLGDIISSTPRIMGPGYLNNFNIAPPFGYNDSTYNDFIKSNDYANRQLVFVGANDGMLHAFKLGKLLQKWTGKNWYEAAKQEGATGAGGIGSEAYAYIPKNVLPYLHYLQDTDYCHVYMVDGPTAINDVTINKTSTSTSCTDEYWKCPKQTTVDTTTKLVDFDKTSWRTVLVGSAGIGGATCNAATPDADGVNTPISVDGNAVGWSSYFALDVTDQSTSKPKLLWEFSHPDLGVTNVGPAIIKVGGNEKRCAINSNTVCTTDVDCNPTATNGKCTATNGRWLAVLASGSTGPISSLEFKGTSDKSLKLFVLDLKTGALLRTIDTGAGSTNLGITNAFAGSISSSALDLEKDRPGNIGNYQDDALYIGYVKDISSGGVIRLVINDDINPNNWTVSKVIDGIGPVTTSVVNLLDRKNKKLWLYFAEGRYFYKLDDTTGQRRLYGIEEPCFDANTNTISSTCNKLELTNLQNQSTAVCSVSTTTICDKTSDCPSGETCNNVLPLSDTKKGWYVNMNSAAGTMGAERVISNPTPDPLGAIFFLSFAPTSNVCDFGGTTYLWGMDYKTGGAVTYDLQGKALIQVSTGEIKELNLEDALSEDGNRKSEGFKGIPPTGQGLMIISPPVPIKKFMHVQEQ